MGGQGAMRVYKVFFMNQGKVYEVYAKAIRQGELYGFVEIENLLFGDRGGMLVDPAEERLKSEFQGVKRSLVPVHAVIRIDEVEQEGQSKIHDADPRNNVTPFPLPPTDRGPDRR
jgi:hypothetical protein